MEKSEYKVPNFQVKKLTKWKQEPDVPTLKEDLQASKNAHDNHMLRIRKWNNLRNVEGEYKPKKIKGRSSVQPKLVRRQAEWRYSALSEPFLSSDKLYNVDPRTFEDETGATQNEIVLNWQFDTKINKVRFIDEFVRTTVDEGTSIIRVGWERITEKVKVQNPIFEFYEAQTQEELQQLEMAAKTKLENPREFTDLTPELKAAVDYFIENGMPVVAKIVDYEEIEEEKIIENRPTLGLVDPENFYIDPSCQNEYEKAGFMIVSFETSKAELKRDGRFRNLDNVNWSGNTILSEPDHNSSTPNDFNFKDDLRKRVVAHEYWGNYDIHGDGKLIPIVATWIGDTMIRMEENPFPDGRPPFILVPYLPIKRQVHGEPDAELLEENQKILGAVTRGTIDLMGRSANSQQGFAKGFLDVTNRRRFESGQDYEFNPGTDPRISVFQHTYPEIPNSALTVMQLQNQEAESLSGVKAFHGGISGEAYGDVAAGIKGMLDASSKREMNILRRLAKGMRDIGRKMMMMNAVFMSEEEIIRVTNKEFVKVKREELKGEFDLKVDISTPEVDQARSQDLSFMLQTIGPDLDEGLRQMILAEIATLKKMPVLAEKLLRYKPEPDPLVEKMKQLELAKLEAEIEKIRSKIALNMAKAEESDADAQLLKLDRIEQETGTKHARDLQKSKAQAKGNQDLEVTKGLLKPLKDGERRPDVPAAIGYNALSKLMDQSDPDIYNTTPPPNSFEGGSAQQLNGY